MVKVSVIIPVYNAEEFLDESINSVLNQSLEDIELICVNDGSKDNSLEILNNFSKKDKRVKVFDKPNGGCGSARNKGLDNATGEFIYFFDPDDYILPNALEELYANAIINNSDLVMFKIARFRDGEPVDYSIPGFEMEKVFPNVDFNNFTFNYSDVKNHVLNSSFAPWTKLYRKKLIDKYPDFRFDLNVAFDDVPFHVKSLLRAERISYIPKFFYKYRLSNLNSVNNTASNGIDIFKICNLVEIFLKDNNYFKEFTEEFILFKITQILNYILSSMSEEYYQKAKNDFKNIKKEFLDNSNYNINIPSHLMNKFNNVLKYDSLKKYKLNLENNQIKPENKSQITNLQKNNSKDLTFNSKKFLKIMSEFDYEIESLKKLNKKNIEYFNWKTNTNTNSQPLISIIMPSLNVNKYIDECIKSVINQTIDNIQIICVDAGSTDGTFEILEQYAKEDPRIILIKSNEKSYGYQMNIGIKRATGKYIGIVETDDYIKKDMFEVLYGLTENGTIDIAKANFWHMDDNNPKSPKINADGTKKHLPLEKFKLQDNPNILNGHPSIWAGIYRREFLLKNNITFMEEPGGGWVDNPFLFETMCVAESIKYKDEPYYYYREFNPNSSTNNLLDLNLPMKRMMNILDILNKYNCHDEKILVALYVRIFWHIKDILKRENFEENKDNICKKFKLVLKRVDENIVKKYFKKEDQEIYYQYLTYEINNMNVLFTPSDNNKTSGAFLSMINLCVYLRDKYNVNISVILPMEGQGVEILDLMNINYKLIPSKDWVVPLSKKRDENYQKAVDNKKHINEIAVKKIGDFIDKNDIDILHINTTWAYVGALAALEKNIPFIWHLREFLEEDQNNTTWDRLENNKLINKANKVIAISNSIYNKYIDIIDDEKLVCIYNGIDAKTFYKPNKKILQNKKVILIMVGGFEFYKGQIEFAQGCVKAYEKGYYNFEVWFIGMGRQDVKDKVKNIFKKAGMEHIVKYLGYKYDVENYYKQSDISFTCAKSEAFGRTTVEAMLSGNLVIGANTAGTKELIENNETGLLYEQGNSDDLSEKIIYAITNPKKSEKIAEKGRKYMFENMTSEINADKIYKLYKEIL